MRIVSENGSTSDSDKEVSQRDGINVIKNVNNNVEENQQTRQRVSEEICNDESSKREKDVSRTLLCVLQP